MARTLTLPIGTQAEMTALATALAPLLRAGDVVLLDGPLAAGKTFFVKALMAALGSEELVTSPTYAIANIYEAPDFDVLHVDVYRLKNAREFYHLGLEDQVETGVSLIEWGSRIVDAFDTPLSIGIALGESETARSVTLSAEADRWSAVFDALEARS